MKDVNDTKTIDALKNWSEEIAKPRKVTAIRQRSSQSVTDALQRAAEENEAGSIGAIVILAYQGDQVWSTHSVDAEKLKLLGLTSWYQKALLDGHFDPE